MKTTFLVTAFSHDFQSHIHKDQLSSFFLSPVLSHLEPREEKGEWKHKPKEELLQPTVSHYGPFLSGVILYVPWK